MTKMGIPANDFMQIANTIPNITNSVVEVLMHEKNKIPTFRSVYARVKPAIRANFPYNFEQMNEEQQKNVEIISNQAYIGIYNSLIHRGR